MDIVRRCPRDDAEWGMRVAAIHLRAACIDERKWLDVAVIACGTERRVAGEDA
jgi:hypothetical protein